MLPLFLNQMIFRSLDKIELLAVTGVNSMKYHLIQFCQKIYSFKGSEHLYVTTNQNNLYIRIK